MFVSGQVPFAVWESLVSAKDHTSSSHVLAAVLRVRSSDRSPEPWTHPVTDVSESLQNDGVRHCSGGSVPCMSMKGVPLGLVGVACSPQTLGQPSRHESWSSWGIWWAPRTIWRVGECLQGGSRAHMGRSQVWASAQGHCFGHTFFLGVPGMHWAHFLLRAFALAALSPGTHGSCRACPWTWGCISQAWCLCSRGRWALVKRTGQFFRRMSHHVGLSAVSSGQIEFMRLVQQRPQRHACMPRWGM